MAASLCRLGVWLYCGLCIAALLIVPVSVFGWFGVSPDPLSAIFALILGLPGTALVFSLVDVENSTASLFVTAVCMFLNAVLLGALCRWLRRKP